MQKNYKTEISAKMKNCKSVIIFFGFIIHLVLARHPLDPPPRYTCPDRPIFPCVCTNESDEGINVECSNTNLASLSLGLKQIKTLIHTLTISNCNMEKLYGNVFTPLSVKRLIIEDTPIKDISDNTFNSAGELMEELYIKNSWLTRVPPSLKNLTNLRILNIEKSRISYLPDGVFDGMSKLLDLKLADSNVNKITKNIFSGLRKLKRLSLFKNNITDIPRRTFSGQKNLEYLDISYNKFKQLGPHYFSDLGKVLWLNISHNEIPKVNSRSFSRNSLLRVLHLNGNKITTLDANSLRGMRFMRRLYFSDNAIKRVSRGTFRSVSRVGTIDLARNKLTKVDYQMFSDLRFIDTIDLAENKIKTIGKEAFQNIYLTKINMSHNLIEQIGPNIFKNCENITILDLSYNGMKKIDPNAFDENSYTTALRAMFNNFTSMSQIPMETQKGIKVLNVSHNRIIDVPKKYFPDLYELHTIDFSHNNLSVIGRGVFRKLFSIRRINFRNNSLTVLDSSSFGKLPSLLEIDLSYNKLRNIRPGTLRGLTSIRQVFIHHNQLTRIPKPPISLTHMHLAYNKIDTIYGRQPWPTMNSLLYLDLDYNDLRDEIIGGKLNNLNILGTLKLRGNNITFPPLDALQALQSLRILHLDENLITNLTKKAFGRLPVISVLGLSHNKINNVSLSAFEGLLQVTELDLSYNNLSHIPNGAFTTLVAMQKIDLSHNKLQRLQNKTHSLFADCLSIREINLSHNKIPFVTKFMFPQHKWIPYKLQKIDLSHNRMPVLTREILTGTKHLTYLNVSYNILNDIRYGILPNLTKLKILDISGNELEDKVLHSTKQFDVLTNLTIFNLSHNKFTHMPVEILSQLKSLNHLDMSYNDLRFFYPELVEQVKHGLDIYYEGNPLLCNCYLRPIAYWLSSVGRVQDRGDSWDKAKCNEPKFLKDIPVGSIIEEQLVCENAKEAEKFKLNPDVKFRRVREDYNKLEFSWFVNTNEDVGDFHLELRTRSFPHSTLFEKDINYDTRYQILDQVPGGEELNLCLLVKNSAGRIRRWRQDQCRKVGPFSHSTKHQLSAFVLIITTILSLIIVF